MSTNKRRWMRRLLLPPLALVVAVLLLEGLLQIGSLVVSATTRGKSSGWSTESLRVLSLGDSNTYGLWLESEEKPYPAILEREWNRSFETPKIEVVNLGYPGNDSSRILQELPGAIEEYRPDLVTLMVGVNDFWIPPSVGVEHETSALVRWLRAHSRVYKLCYMLVRDVGPGANRELGKPRRRSRPERTLQGNLQRIADLLRHNDIRLILLTYPYGEVQAAANDVLHKFAEDRGIPLVDMAAVFQGIDPETVRHELLFDDNHPREPGHGLIADALLRALNDPAVVRQ